MMMQGLTTRYLKVVVLTERSYSGDQAWRLSRLVQAAFSQHFGQRRLRAELEVVVLNRHVSDETTLRLLTDFVIEHTGSSKPDQVVLFDGMFHFFHLAGELSGQGQVVDRSAFWLVRDVSLGAQDEVVEIRDLALNHIWPQVS